jgi:hypothetical protein
MLHTADYALGTALAAEAATERRSANSERGAPRATVTDIDTQQIRRKPVLNGLINEYMHAA